MTTENKIMAETGARAAKFKPVNMLWATIDPATAPPVAPARF
jgi:hypothetical protein